MTQRCISTSRPSTSSFSILSIYRDVLTSRRRSHLCGFDLNFTYPQQSKFPTVDLKVEPAFINGSARTTRFISNAAHRQLKTNVVKQSLNAGLFPRLEDVHKRDAHNAKRFERRDQWKRDLSGRANGTIDPWYGCDLYDEMIDYALNFSVPWSTSFCNVLSVTELTYSFL